jgi:hypothetical protein
MQMAACPLLAELIDGSAENVPSLLIASAVAVG